MTINEKPRPADGEPKQTTLASWRADIIEGILQHGLIAGDSLKRQGWQWPVLNSGYPAAPCIGGYSFSPLYGDRSRITNSISWSFYKYPAGTLHIIAERNDDLGLSFGEKKARAETRINASLLVVCDGEGRNIHEWTENIPASETLALIFPGHIWGEFMEQKRGDVSNGNADVVVVNDNTQRNMAYFDSVSVPNYEDALVEILVGRNSKIWVHGVRLPTEEDLEKLTLAPQ